MPVDCAGAGANHSYQSNSPRPVPSEAPRRTRWPPPLAAQQMPHSPSTATSIRWACGCSSAPRAIHATVHTRACVSCQHLATGGAPTRPQPGSTCPPLGAALANHEAWRPERCGVIAIVAYGNVASHAGATPLPPHSSHPAHRQRHAEGRCEPRSRGVHAQVAGRGGGLGVPGPGSALQGRLASTLSRSLSVSRNHI